MVAMNLIFLAFTLIVGSLCGTFSDVNSNDVNSSDDTLKSQAVEDQVVNGKRFTLPAGFVIELVAKSPLVDRPISCDFDELGRLYVTDSSGSNENVQEQLKKKPHRIVRLEDTDGDGRFDHSVVFAEQMMFPEGAMWHDGSLYVCAPPQIWKLTDTDGDGKADKREVWFDGKTLTGCANDLHGPYLGPDGWIYWCKGAFAEQTYAQKDGGKFVTRAAHIFRRRPDGGMIEPVMTGGMDNPVELVFTPEGELVFNSTFLHHPHDGKRDGLVHAIYGGVYGKQHGVLEGHPRTGDLMPVLVDHDASAPSGLVRLESDHFGPDYENNILCSSFNMHKVFRHRIATQGSMLNTQNEDFVVCHDLDFHPTDIIEDADGSVLIVDTGGWYKLCCPTSQLVKPDVLGAIYRVRRKNAVRPQDPRGLQLDWRRLNPASLIADPRPVVRRRAQWLAAKQGRTGELAKVWRAESLADEMTRLQAVWTVSKIQSQEARQTIRLALKDSSPRVRQAAAHVVSAWNNPLAVNELLQLLKDKHAVIRRVAAEALGRIGLPVAVPALLDAAGELRLNRGRNQVVDRGLEHALIYALIQIGQPGPLKKAIASPTATIRHVAWMALAQIQPDGLNAEQVIAELESRSPLLRTTAWRLVERNPHWAKHLGGYFRAAFENYERVAPARLAPLMGQPVIQKEMLKVLSIEPNQWPELEKLNSLKIHLISVLGSRLPKKLNEPWQQLPQTLLKHQDEQVLWMTIQMLRLNRESFRGCDFDAALKRIARSQEYPSRLRVSAFAAGQQLKLDDADVEFICELLAVKHSVELRSLAVEAIERASFGERQAGQVASALATTGPTELEKLLIRLSQIKSNALGKVVVQSLKKSPVAASIDLGQLKSLLDKFGSETAQASKSLLVALEQQNAEKSGRLDQILKWMPKADPRRGQEIFHSTKASCIACHQMGYLGGRIGPSLSRIGGIRSERDLLESLMYPSQSFVRSYEPQVFQTIDGRQFSGVVKNETSAEIELMVDAQKTIVLKQSEIENRRAGTRSIMPSGLDKQFTNQELADLIKFLKTAR